MNTKKEATAMTTKNTAIAKPAAAAAETKQAIPALLPEKAETPATQDKPVINLLSPEDRIKRAQNFGIIAKKYEALKEKKEELQHFLLSNDGTKEKITLSNAAGYIFEISNSHTIGRVLNLINQDVDVLLEKSQEQILEFAI